MKRKFLKDYIDGVLEEEDILEIRESEVREVSAVDQPATGIEFAYFKRGGRTKQDFPGLGSDAPGSVGGNSSLVDLTSYLAANPTMDPATAEAESGVREALVDDFGGAGDDATVSDPPTAGDFNSAKGEPAMPRTQKQELEMAAVDPAAAPPEMPAVEVAEVEASAVTWPLTQCIADAEGVGLGENDAVSVCQLIREELGDPEDPDSIMIPDTLTPEGLITSAAMSLGLAAPAGVGGGGSEEPVEGELRAPNKRNRWLRRLKEMAGLNAQPSMIERRLKRLEKEFDVTMKKTNREVMAINRQLLAIIANDRGIDMASLGLAPEEEATPAVATPPADVATAAVVATEPKRAKDEAAVLDEAPIDESEREELDRLRALEASLKDGADVDTLEESDADELVDASLEPTEPEVTEDAPVLVGAAEKVSRPRRTSVAPTPGSKRGQEMVVSTIGGGLLIPKADRDALA
ncbi:MAG: hypothetical protein OES13_00425 [Acidimicrobiia bacterium]|nr:hypothetical protein [Acidimicrobiia bacterium]